MTIDRIGEICVRPITGADFDFIRNTTDGSIDHHSLFARTVIAGVCNEDGKPEFTRKDVGAVSAMPFWKLRALAEVVQQHGGITDDDLEEIEGNSPPTTPNDSGTG